MPKRKNSRRGEQSKAREKGPWDNADIKRLHPENSSSAECSGVEEFNPWATSSGESSGAEESDPWDQTGIDDRPSGSGRVCISAAWRSSHPESLLATHSKYAREGSDPAVIRKRYAKGACICKGKPACHMAVPISILDQICKLYWSVSDAEKAFLLHLWYADARGTEEAPVRKVAWWMHQSRLCFPNFCYLLGTSTRTVRKYLHTGSKTHSAERQARDSPQADRVDFFFMELYSSAAEPLPRPTWTCVMGTRTDADVTYEDNPWLDANDENLLSQDMGADLIPELPNVEQRTLLTLAAKSSEVVVGLPRRFLPHGRVHYLYWMFVAAWDVHSSPESPGVQAVAAWDDHESSEVPGVQVSADIPSYPTFWRRWDSVWKRYLRMRKTSEHAQCNTCHELHQRLELPGLSVADRLDVARALREHLRSQYLDRCVYWSLRFASATYSLILCIIIDSMDKTKFAWPRYPFSRKSHELDSFVRPKMVLTAAIAHGWCANVLLAQDNLNHGADAFCEVLCRTLEHVWRICKRTGRAMPAHLVIQSDNTVSQAKNTFVTMFLAYLVSKYKFVSVDLLFLMVGHTHEDIGAPATNDSFFTS